MTVLQLRNHIPISGPARREAVDGTETAMRVSLGFEPDWYYRRCEVDFGEQWHTDPLYRHQTLVRMKQELHRAFPTVPYWNPDDETDTWTISGCYGAYPINRLFGFKLEYNANDWPWPDVAAQSTVTLEEYAAMDVDQMLAGPFVAELFAQMDIIEREGGKIHGYLNWQGVLNNAFNLLGQQIFVEIVANPELARLFFAVISDAMIGLAKAVQARQRASGFYIDQISVSNCTVSMISPRHYSQFILPNDLKIAQSFERFGYHTCNWNIDPYIDAIHQLPQVGYLDMGHNSNLLQAREMFPEARRAVMYSPVTLHDAPLAEIRADMERIYATLAPCDIVMADIQAKTPDSRVNALLDICREIEEEGEL
jgi:hypothetical protein